MFEPASFTKSRHGTAGNIASIAAARIRTAMAAIAASTHPSAESAWLVDAQLRLFRQATRYNAFLLSVGALLVSQACAEWIPWQTRTIWWIAASCVSIGIELIARRMDHASNTSLPAVRARAYTSLATVAVFTTAWASMMIFLWSPSDEINHMALVLIIACTLAGSTAISSMHPAMAVTAYSICAAFLTGRLAFAESTLDRTLAALSTVFIALMAGQLVALMSTSRKMLCLEHERSELVGELQHAKDSSDKERARAYSAGRTKSQFLSNLNHELRTPMNAILGFSELIKHKSFGDAVDKYAEYAEIIHSSGKQLLSLIDDMIDLAKIEGGRMGLRETEVDLKGIILDAMEANETAAAEANVALNKRLERGIPKIVADERAIRQIIANLMSNALKFTPGGGQVTLFAHMNANGRPSFGVEDTGVGIAPDAQAGAFERFGKSRHNVATTEKGMGLGLAIVKGFAEAHDGEVRLESAPGRGTKITVTLPASRTLNPAELQKLAS